jgi:ABC-type nitrate/sulfonate/bicarbonate transport system substrate-binding protein
MFKWPVLAAVAVASAFHPAEGAARPGTETIFAIPSQTMTFTAHYVAHEAGLFQKGRKD